ncbi:MAG TPA: PepSY-associated TM helix domain-containing protein [Allosphingosinicella sp.]|nr:PepSY-associated TM helix domain-containing protein [Allosphingosinicella sp.]
MAQSTTLKLRAVWMQIHKWIGIALAILIIPLSLSGSALVWHDWLDGTINPQRYDVKAGEAALPPSAYQAAAARAMEPGERLVSIRYGVHGGPLVATIAPAPDTAAAKTARPVRMSVWIDPADGRVLDRARSDAGPVRFLHVLHGSLQMPGVGRQIVGWIGVFMLISSLTGLWLWWPLRGRWTRGLKWRRQNATSANLHHQTGFWIAIPLAMLSFTGAWISFPAFFGAISGAPQPQAADRARAMRAVPLAETRLSADAAVAAAKAHAAGGLASIAWPTDQAPEWKIGFDNKGGAAEVKVSDADGKATPPSPSKPEPIARTMRRLHDGTGMGLVWQIVIFLGGIAPALLAITGIIMWLRSRGWRARLKERRLGGALTPAPAE